MDRNAQFEYISKKAGSFLTDGQPVISVDTKYARTGIMHGLESGAHGQSHGITDLSGMNASAGVPRASFFFR
jgi:hypothetical protein